MAADIMTDLEAVQEGIKIAKVALYGGDYLFDAYLATAGYVIGWLFLLLLLFVKSIFIGHRLLIAVAAWVLV